MWTQCSAAAAAASDDDDDDDAVTWLQPTVMCELEGVVVLDADDNHITTSYDDVAALPTKLVCYYMFLHGVQKKTPTCVSFNILEENF